MGLNELRHTYSSRQVRVKLAAASGPPSHLCSLITKRLEVQRGLLMVCSCWLRWVIGVRMTWISDL